MSGSELAPDGNRVERVDNTKGIPLGTWVWINDDDDGETVQRFACVTHIGSNYIKVETPRTERRGGSYWRVHFNEINDLIEIEEDPDSVIKENIESSRQKVQQLLNDAQKVLEDIGLRDRSLPGPESDSNALAVASGETDIKAHKNALVKAKDKDLPDIFKQIENSNANLAMWMSAKVMPMKAQIGPVKEVINEINDRIFTVELYAGLLEEVERVRDGEPAGIDEKLHIMQRRSYMDEECLLDYRAGGMDITSLKKFDKWISKKKNFTRIFPFPRCMVSFRIRRNVKQREWDGTLAGVFYICNMNQSDKLTFLYIRNGDRLYRMNTEIKFGSRMFPGRKELLATNKMWGKKFVDIDEMITDGEYQEIVKERREDKKKAKAWKRKHPKKEWWHCPYEHHHLELDKEYEPYDPSSVYFDDMDKMVKERIRDYNRIAYIVQGLLDRSEILHPHPPAKLWTQEGFERAITLIYDDDNALYPSAEPPDFMAYVAECNKSLKTGSITVGQEDFWERKEAVRYNNRESANWRNRNFREVTHHSPYGNPGPGYLARISKWLPRTRKAEFRWQSERAYSWGSRSWHKSDMVNKRLVVPENLLFNIEAYQPGDFKQFFQDPRTRARYLKWAKVLMAAEDFHAGVLKIGPESS